MKKRLLSILGILFLISFISAASVGTSDMTKGKVVYTPPVFINYSLIPIVNSSANWDNLNSPVDLLLSLFSPTWIDITLDMNNNIIENILNLFVVGNVTVDGDLITSGTYNNLSIISGSDWIYLSGDGSIESGFDISIPKYANRDFYYGYGGLESHYFGEHGNELIIDKDGNIISLGTITSENVFLPAYISSHTNDTIAVASAGVWYNVTFDQEASEFKKRIIHTYNDDTNTTLTIQYTGIYEITYTMSFEDSAAVPTSHIVTRVTKNNVELNGFTIEEDLGIQNQDSSLHHSDLVSLITGDKIVLSFTSDDTTVSLSSHLTYGIHKNTGHLTIKRIA